MEKLTEKKIRDIVGESHVSAAVLHYFGIPFYHYGNHTLTEACREKNLRPEVVAGKLAKAREEEPPLHWAECPVDLIIRYLKHAHHIFIKYRIGYITTLIEAIPLMEAYEEQLKDLKTAFPLFAEDFVEHVYEEEDTLFSYVQTLARELQAPTVASKTYFLLEKYSIQDFALQHYLHEHEMKGIQEITGGYSVGREAPLSLQVLYSEMAAFDKALEAHARIENEVLLPRALALEQRLKERLKQGVMLH